MSFKRAILIFLIVTMLVPLNAYWQLLPWSKLRKEATNLAGKVLTSMYSTNVSAKEANELENKVFYLEEQINEYTKQDNTPDDFREVSELVSSLKVVVRNLDKRVSSLEERVDSLETRLSLTERVTPIINRTVSNKHSKKVLRNIKPSFNCSKAKKDIEHSICTSLVLRDIDGRMGRVYRELRHKTSYSNSLKKEQLAWLKKRDEKCTPYDETCLVSVYKDRIYQLKQKI